MERTSPQDVRSGLGRKGLTQPAFKTGNGHFPIDGLRGPGLVAHPLVEALGALWDQASQGLEESRHLTGSRRRTRKGKGTQQARQQARTLRTSTSHRLPQIHKQCQDPFQTRDHLKDFSLARPGQQQALGHLEQGPQQGCDLGRQAQEQVPDRGNQLAQSIARDGS